MTPAEAMTALAAVADETGHEAECSCDWSAHRFDPSCFDTAALEAWTSDRADVVLALPDPFGDQALAAVGYSTVGHREMLGIR